MFFFVYKNRFLARQIGPVMAFIPNNISVHVHLFEDNDPIKNKDGCCQLGFSVQKQQMSSAKIITGLSLSILSAEEGQNFFKLWCSF